MQQDSTIDINKSCLVHLRVPLHMPRCCSSDYAILPIPTRTTTHDLNSIPPSGPRTRKTCTQPLMFRQMQENQSPTHNTINTEMNNLPLNAEKDIQSTHHICDMYWTGHTFSCDANTVGWGRFGLFGRHTMPTGWRSRSSVRPRGVCATALESGSSSCVECRYICVGNLLIAILQTLK